MKKEIFIFITLSVSIISVASEARVFDPIDYGAKPDGVTLCTKAIQIAIDECAAGGGGTVRLQGGQFLSGTVFMKSNITLEIAENATLLGSTDLADYPVTIPDVLTTSHRYTNKSLIYGENLTNIAIIGKGTYDGQGASFEGDWLVRPFGIRFVECTNVRMEDLTLRNSPMWMQHYLHCDNVTVRGITVWNHCNKNNDMIDIDGCHNVLIENCVSDTDDDGLTLKSTSKRACDVITIRNCTLSSHCNALKCGTESLGGFKNMTVSNCVIKPSAQRTAIYGDPDGLAGIALEIVDGGIMENVRISDVEIEGTHSPIFIRLGNRGRRINQYIFARLGIEKTPINEYTPGPDVGILRNVTISDVNATTPSAMGCAIAGIENHRIENLTLKNLNISFAGGGVKDDIARRFDEKAAKYPECKMFADRLPAYGFFFWHVKDVVLDNVKMEVT
ncbi:MAG: glycoside hydrolase family 28 protein, partial [bacterium]